MMLDNSKYFSHELEDAHLDMVEKINRSLNLEIREIEIWAQYSLIRKTLCGNFPTGFFRIISPIRKRKGTISFLGVGSDRKEYQYELRRRGIEQI